MIMFLRRMIGVAGVLVAASALALVLPGCGGSQEVGPHGEVKAIPLVNPTPEAAKPETTVPAK